MEEGAGVGAWVLFGCLYFGCLKCRRDPCISGGALEPFLALRGCVHSS